MPLRDTRGLEHGSALWSKAYTYRTGTSSRLRHPSTEQLTDERALLGQPALMCASTCAGSNGRAPLLPKRCDAMRSKARPARPQTDRAQNSARRGKVDSSRGCCSPKLSKGLRLVRLRVTRLVGRGCLRNGAAVRRSPEVFGAEGLIAAVAHEWQKVELQNPRTR